MLGLLLLSLLAPTDWRTLEVPDRAPLEYALLAPADATPDRPHPVLLALPPGGQDRAMVERLLELYLNERAPQRGWVVVAPALPSGVDSLAAAGPWIDALLAELARGPAAGLPRTEPAVHVAGVSNGGVSALALAHENPDRFASLTCLPGLVRGELDALHLDRLARLPLALYVGADDDRWVAGARALSGALQARGARDVELILLPGQGHLLPASVGDDLLDRLASLRRRTAERDVEHRAIDTVLDALHHAAATANEAVYFDLYTPDAVFLGTDETERWTLDQFRAYALPHFQRESAWVYYPRERHVRLAPGGGVAWFDEKLTSEKYGPARGSGTLVKTAGRWRIAHYVLSFPIPNDLAGEVTDKVKGMVK